jgi:hypothetical protein
MANITLTIPDAQVSRVITAVCASRTEKVTLLPIDPTAANAKAVVAAWIKECVCRYEEEQARLAIVVDVTGLVT